MKRLIVAALGLTVACSAFAGGYRVSLQGQRALAMGHTGVAMTDSAEVVFFNPGAMTQLTADTDIIGGLTLLDGETIYQSQQTLVDEKTDNPLGTPVNGYVVQKISNELSWGFGIYTPYGNKVEWPTDWAGSHLVNYIELSAVYFQPTIGYQINDKTSIGFGPNLVYGTVEFNRNLDTGSFLFTSEGRSNVTVEDSRMLTVTPYEKTMVGPIEKAILTSDLGLNPTTAGTVIRVPMPPLTEERRKELVRVVRELAENARVAVRNIRRDANSDIKDLQKEKEISEDEDHRGQELVQQVTNEAIAEIEEMLQAKEKELMEI